ncbi:hypothetical protein [Sphingobium limneticum]|uniref:Uncharacterized protein n=1 Tax=Sphingobium limneticum TaxID=1007511 RepID=A0A5J5HPV1_9SPHN|nr:hypothetical protein [Sphingobium limneticum]KAA9010933.1 hypothetical protein F4U96_24035 [Sphingobium limneticum]KAA9023020.1 hypothetical protein F4U95_23960 [Sphingobium limneticum]
MAKKKPQINTPEVVLASFKTAEMAALFGLTRESIGTVTFHQNGIATVDFGTAKAQRVSASMFVFAVDPAATLPAIKAPALVEALKGMWEADDEGE